MRFSDALRVVLDDGGRVTRGIWSPGNFIMMREAPEGPLVELYVDDGSRRITWTPNQRDLHATDWEIAPPPKPIKVLTIGFEDFGPMGGR